MPDISHFYDEFDDLIRCVQDEDNPMISETARRHWLWDVRRRVGKALGVTGDSDDGDVPTLTVATLADVMDHHSDDGQWNGGDICAALSNLIHARDGWSTCSEHGSYSAAKPTCPWCPNPSFLEEIDQDLLARARGLVDGPGNTEYVRGIAELIIDHTPDLNQDEHKELLIEHLESASR